MYGKDWIISSKSKREYLEAIYLRYRRASRKKKALSWMNFALYVDIIGSTPSGFSSKEV
jgi:hypothetical protein